MQNVYRKEIAYTESAKKLKELAAYDCLSTVITTLFVYNVVVPNASLPVAIGSSFFTIFRLGVALRSSIAVLYHSMVNRPKLTTEKKLLALNASLLLANDQGTQQTTKSEPPM